MLLLLKRNSEAERLGKDEKCFPSLWEAWLWVFVSGSVPGTDPTSASHHRREARMKGSLEFLLSEHLEQINEWTAPPPCWSFPHKAPGSITSSSRNVWCGIVLGVLNRKALSHGILMEEFPAV